MTSPRILVLLATLLLGYAASSLSSETTGLATYYTTESCRREGNSGVYTASGAKFDEGAFTCALRRRDWGAKFRVTSLETGKSIEVTLTDYGPGRKPTARGVVVDLTPAAFKALGTKPRQGEVRVRVEQIAEAPKHK